MAIDLSIILSLVIGTLVIFYMDYKKQDEIKEKDNIIRQKYDSIRPYSEIVGKYDDFIDFLYSIQDMYIYNPQAYEEMVDNIDEFLKIYEQVKLFPKLAGKNYSIAEKNKLIALNALHSIIYTLPPNKFYGNKLIRSIEKLDTLLSRYLKDIYIWNNNYNKTYGYTNESVVINKGPKPINFHSNEPYVFDIFS
jgi:hypothetical protein